MHTFPNVVTRAARLAACTLVAAAGAACAADTVAASDRPALPQSFPPSAADSGAVVFDSAGTAPATATLAWSALTRRLVERNQPNQQAALRAFAYTTLAEHAAIVALDDALPGAVPARGAAGRGRQELVRRALSAAAAAVLAELFPRDSALVAAQLAEIAGPPEALPRARPDDRRARATEIGEEVGRAVVARARGDRFDAPWTGVVPTGPGTWASAFVPARAPLLPRLGEARTFFMARGDQFRPAPPPAVGSAAFQAALAEVRRYSDTRTPEQRRIAEAWGMTTGSLAAGYWNAVADSLVARDRLPEARAAHVLAMTNMAAWDANVACHDAKYAYWLARPTQMDPGIVPALGLPNHPSYPSNHACLSGAAAEILAGRFPGDAAALRAQAEEAMVSRVYAGLHYRFDGEAGLGIARRVAALAEARDAAVAGRHLVR